MAEHSQRSWSEQATLDDVYYCYRLLLGREPDQEGLKFWTERLATESFTYSKLAAHFCQSEEYLTSAQARGLRLIDFDDVQLYVNRYDWDVGERMIRTGNYEPHVATYLKQHLRAGMTFVDVGANVGYFTVIGARQVGPSGRVIAVECNPKNCELIYLNALHNGFKAISVYPLAVSDQQKLMGFTAGFSNLVVKDLSANVDDDNCGYEKTAVVVPAVTLDFLLHDESRIDFIKMDIEGSEGRAWQGMLKVIERYRPGLVIEFFPHLIKQNSQIQPEELLESIFAHGYHGEVLEPDSNTTQAASTAEVMAAWEKRASEIGDQSKTYLDLAFSVSALKG